MRDLRRRGPETEKALETEEEIVITRDGKAVAKLVPFSEPDVPRPRFDPRKHLQQMKKVLDGKTLPSIDIALAARRSDRFNHE
jgi:antitoxin (DNA-binding transcriptional repressor) of toxin-antitoxin stability system